MCAEHICLGKRGEEFACQAITKMGYKILERNFRTRLGEIDVVALDEDVVVFIEIKTRRHSIGYAKEAINRKKRKKLCMLADYYMKKRRIVGKRARFDVVVVWVNKDKFNFELIKDAFSYER